MLNVLIIYLETFYYKAMFLSLEIMFYKLVILVNVFKLILFILVILEQIYLS